MMSSLCASHDVESRADVMPMTSRECIKLRAVAPIRCYDWNQWSGHQPQLHHQLKAHPASGAPMRLRICPHGCDFEGRNVLFLHLIRTFRYSGHRQHRSILHVHQNCRVAPVRYTMTEPADVKIDMPSGESQGGNSRHVFSQSQTIDGQGTPVVFQVHT